jgi:hypothetical protein
MTTSLNGNMAVYKALFDMGPHHDILSPFVRITSAAIFKLGKRMFTVYELHDVIERDWYTSIPVLVLRTILGRIILKGAIAKNKTDRDKYQVKDIETLRKISIEIDELKRAIESDIDFLVSDFIDYTHKKEGVLIPRKDAINSMEQFVAEQATTLSLGKTPEVEKAKIYFAVYFYDKYLTDPKIVEILKTISFGFILAESIYLTLPNKLPSFSNMKIVFDTPVIFKLLGISEIDETLIYTSMIESLKKSKAKLFVFNHSINEIEGILEDSSFWIDSGDFDYSRASETSMYYLEKGFTKADIEEDRLSLRQRVLDFGIQIISESYQGESIKYNKDILEITKCIVQVYKERNSWFNEVDKKQTIYWDAKSINDIYILRKDAKPQNLSNCDAIFVTSNGGLVTASKRFNDLISDKVDYYLPTCVLDVSLGTYLWLSNPIMMKNLAVKQMISQAYSIMTPSKALFEKFSMYLEKSKEKGEISPEIEFMMRTSQFVRQELVRVTLQSCDSVDSTTHLKVLEKMKLEQRQALESEYQEREKIILEEKEAEIERIRKQNEDELSKKENEKLKADIENEKLLGRISLKVDKKLNRFRIISLCFPLVVFILAGATILAVFFNYETKQLNIEFILPLGGLCTTAGVFYYFLLFGSDSNELKRLHRSILSWVRTRIEKEYK